jgi:hypothetical protein
LNQATVRLTRFISEEQSVPGGLRQAWPVSILAQGTNMEDHIFVYRVGSEHDPMPGDRFECVASVNQMFEIPRNHGSVLTLSTAIPYYRTNVLEYVARSAEEALDIWKKVQQEVQWLVSNFNSARVLQATEVAVISETLIDRYSNPMNPPKRVLLSYHPAGTPGVDGDGNPTITSADIDRVGWLPVSELGAGAVIPAGARFYYNIDRDQGLLAAWPPLEPLDGNQLHRNGIQMPYGIVWSLDYRTVWWHAFDPATIPGYARADGQVADGPAPWPTDYINMEAPGDIPNSIVLTLFK